MTSRLSLGFPGMFTSLVAEAAMELPPLTRDEDRAFLQQMTMYVMEIFWANYANMCDEFAQEEFSTAQKTTETSEAWLKKYADFRNDLVAAKKAEAVLADLARTLPAAVQLEYAQFQENLNQA